LNRLVRRIASTSLMAVAVALLYLSSLDAVLAQAKTGYQQDVELIGADHQTFMLKAPERKNPATCARACKADPSCEAWTYVRPGGLPEAPDMTDAICRLKSEVADTRSSRCCISGYKGAAEAEDEARPKPKEARRFTRPRLDGIRLDSRPRANAGFDVVGVAHSFCRMMGYSGMESYRVADAGQTVAIADGTVFQNAPKTFTTYRFIVCAP